MVNHTNQVQTDREVRENNVIIFNAAESTSSEVTVRKKDDQKLFKKLCSHVLDKPLPVKNILRIGKKQQSNTDENVSSDDENIMKP